MSIAMCAATAAELPDPVLRDVLAYWRSLGGGRGLPSADEVYPLGMGARILPHILLIDVEAGGGLRYRLCGTAIDQMAGRPLKGVAVDGNHPNAEYNDFLLTLYRRAITGRRPIYSETSYLSPNSGGLRTTRRLLCPLSHDGVTVTRLLGAQTFQAGRRRSLEVPLSEIQKFQIGPIREL